MKLLIILGAIVALAACAPTSKEASDSKESDKLIIDDDFFPNELKIYTAEHDIVSLNFPLNGLNFDETENEDSEDKKVIFFVEADGNDFKGISVFINGNVTKLLATGTSVAADNNEDYKIAFFGATDGLYIYNATLNKAVKYGPITDSIIDIVKANGTDLIYILTDKNELFKVTEEGSKKEKLDIVGAKQIVLDDKNNLYYYNNEKIPHVYIGKEAKAIEGLPSEIEFIKLLNPAFVMEDGVPVVVNDKAFIIYSNGTSLDTDIEFKTKPSAYSIEGTLIQYYAREKSIYEYNIISLLVSDLVQELKTYFNDKDDEIQQLATRSRADF